MQTEACSVEAGATPAVRNVDAGTSHRCSWVDLPVAVRFGHAIHRSEDRPIGVIGQQQFQRLSAVMTEPLSSTEKSRPRPETGAGLGYQRTGQCVRQLPLSPVLRG